MGISIYIHQYFYYKYHDQNNHQGIHQVEVVLKLVLQVLLKVKEFLKVKVLLKELDVMKMHSFHLHNEHMIPNIDHQLHIFFHKDFQFHNKHLHLYK